MAAEFGASPLSTSEVSSDRPDSSSARRRRRPTARVACNACRMKKTRCDSQRPVCGWCASHPGVQCVYDTGSPEETRSAALKRENEALKRDLERAELLLQDLASLPDQESMELLQRMRGRGNSNESPAQTSTHGYAEHPIPGGYAATRDAMRSIQPMLNGIDSATQSQFEPGSATAVDRQTPNKDRHVSSASFGSPSFSLTNRQPLEPIAVSGGVQREPTGLPMGAPMASEGGGSLIA